MVIKQRAISDEQKEERRLAILAAALRLFQDTSYEELSIAAVAHEAGIAKGTVYLYFRTKEELFLDLQIQEFEAWFDELYAELQALGGSCNIDSFIALLARSLAARPALVRLIAILHTVLERNIDVPTARRFKVMLRDRSLQAGPLLERCLPFLRPGQGVQLLLRINALVIGFQHVAEPAPVIRRVLDEPGLELFKIDFIEEFLATLKALLYGLQTQARSEK